MESFMKLMFSIWIVLITITFLIEVNRIVESLVDFIVAVL